MKKSLIALAALATVATAAQAQSSVTIYGVVDAGFASVDKVGTTAATAARQSGIQNGGLSTPRLGFRGVEDLGQGMKASFVLENEFLVDTGVQAPTTSGVGTSTLFIRESTVSLSKDGVGSVRMGRFNRQDYQMAATFDAFGGNNIGGLVAAGSLGAVSLGISTRLENAIELKTASFNGLSAVYQRQFGEATGTENAGRTDAYGLNYASGNLELAFAQAKQNLASGNNVGKEEFTNTGLYARYNFGFAKVVLGYLTQDNKHTATATSNIKEKGQFIGANIPVSANVTINAQYLMLDDGATDAKKPDVYALGVNYALSKRTTVYGIYAASKQDNGSNQNIVSASKMGTMYQTAAGNDQKAYMVGVRHTF